MIVKCPYCGESFDREKVECTRGQEGFYPTRYFHPNCYTVALNTEKKDWPEYKNKLEKAGNDLKLWTDMCYDFLQREMKVSVNYVKIRTQLETFNKSKKMKYEGMYKTLVYCYTILHVDRNKAEGGIGIVPYEYENAKIYFKELVETKNNLLEAINKQIEDKKSALQLTFEHRKPGQQKKKKFDISKIAEME